MIKPEKTGQRIRELILQTLDGKVPDATAITEDIMTALNPIIGEAALKRVGETNMMGAYREGFLTGRSAGRFARWHAQIWRSSQMFKSLREPVNDEAKARFDRYNY